MSNTHTFHIPVLGIGYSIDTPLKVAHYGIDSTMSLVDDILLEKLRKMYCEKHEMPYTAINEKTEDYRAKRITAYLNLIKILSEENFQSLIEAASDNQNKREELMRMMPPGLLRQFTQFISDKPTKGQIKDWLQSNLSRGGIDVNIMTKLDRENYYKGLRLPNEYNDAHAALRGFANSDLESTLVLSAGINPRLYTYMQGFKDFYPDKAGKIKKKIALKVSDRKSALIQGKFLAKKGLWVSEFRIESGLNCGGHAFATEGYLMGPILAEFRDNFEDLKSEVYEILISALKAKDKDIPAKGLPLRLTAQGGVGTAQEHQFLIDHYKVDSVGWGTPFMLVPEATTVDDQTLEKMKSAKEKDLYLSDISPLGIPFNSLRGNTKDLEKLAHIANGKPGSSCSKKYAALSTEFSDKTICLASRRYQTLKLKELSKAGLTADEYREEYNKVVEKSCICTGLGTSSLLAHKLDTITEGEGVSVCPGPNMAYFNKSMSLREITDHIYGKANFMSRKDRPNMFVKELQLYIDYLNGKLRDTELTPSRKKLNYLKAYTTNMQDGIAYYRHLFEQNSMGMENHMKSLEACSNELNVLKRNIENLSEEFQLAVVY